MWKFTLAQMRRHVSRLAAAGLAIILSTGFIAAAVIGMTAIADTARNAFSADLGKADLIATAAGTGEWLPAGAEAAARATAGVSDTYTPLRQTAVAIGPEHREKIIAQSAPGNPAFLPELAQGRGPAGPDEVVIGAQLAERLGLKVEDELSLTWSLSIPDNLPAAEQEALIAAVEAGELETTRPRQARISGLFKDNNLSLSSSQPGLIGFGQAQDPASGLLDFRPGDTLFLLVEPQADDNATAAAVKQAISPGDSAWQVLAKKDLVEQREQSILGNSSVIGAFVGVFISVALLTAGLVISNTLQVMVAQRARTLSLLRCIGATKAQIRRSVLGEAVLLGGFGGLGGIALGAALIQAALLIARQAYPDIPVPSLISFPPAAVVLPLLAGLAVTAIAALAPARLATRVAPVAALRPQTAPSLKARAGRFRLAFSLLAAVGGAGLLAYAIFLMKQAVGGDASPDNIFTYVGIGVLGGASFFVGAIVGGVFWIPRVVSAVASLVGRFGPGARIAAANTMRNPRRTAATAT
ncbi:MAG: FtsX-like permease family protein, partial [Propionibacteriaceae bacterium]|nr:FtsX-like permease family protein [Propionibacteriaceae bacterium]